MNTMLALPELIGRRVVWNGAGTHATILSAWAFMNPKKAGDTVVGYEPETHAVFSVDGHGTVTSRLTQRLVEVEGRK